MTEPLNKPRKKRILGQDEIILRLSYEIHRLRSSLDEGDPLRELLELMGELVSQLIRFLADEVPDDAA